MKKRLSTLLLVRCFLFIGVMLFSSMPLPASAMDIPFFSSNNILYYDGSTGGACGSVGPKYSTPLDIPNLQGNDNAEKIWNFLKEQGLSDEQAAGVMGNIQQESGFDPGAAEVIPSYAGQGYGIMQWTGPRRIALENFASDKNVPASDLGVQIAFLLTEIETETVGNYGTNEGRHKPQFGSPTDNLWEALKKQTSVLDATVLFHDGFLRSNDSTEEIEGRRGGFASAVYEEFTGRSPSGGPGGNTGTNCSAVGSGDLAAVTLEYAWPDYKGPGFVEMMPAYKAVVDKGPSFRDMGGTAYRGVDCVGFVTTLLIDSGFDPNFNYAGKYYGKAPGRGADIERSWLESADSGWEKIASEGQKTDGGTLSSSDLLPGDVAVTPLRHQSQNGGSIPGHTFVFVGQIDGFNSQYASSSMDDRAPMATSGDYESAANTKFEWWRKVK